MRRLLIVFLLLVAFAVLAAAVGVFFARGSNPLGGDMILTWRLDAPLVDYSETPDLSVFFPQRATTGLARIHQTLSRARDDDRVKGLALYIHDSRFGFGKAQEIRSLLQSFTAAGKFVDCYLETAGEGTNGTLSYYLATACERITVSPLGEWNVVGLYSDSPFVRGTLDKLRIEPQFLHVGDYKSAAEFYTETEHSQAAAQALGAVLDDLYDQIVEAISTTREIPADEVREIIDRAPLNAEQALERGLIDEVTYPDVFAERFGERLQAQPIERSLADYSATSTSLSRHRVAVVFAQGTIIRGGNGTDSWSQQRYVGSESMRQILQSLAEDSNLAGVVLRIDSPGGSPVASDLILRELELLAKEMPVVVSMSDVAASGGYYIASKAAKIVAQSATITGSIGVVGGKFATREFQRELLGITHDEIQRGANADFFSSLDTFSPAQEAQYLAHMTRIYDIFVDHVATGREMPRDEVESVAGGRIWTGQQASEIGLVDEIGGLSRAIELVLETAGHDPSHGADLEFYPRPPSFFDMLSRSLSPFLELRSIRLPVLPVMQVPQALELPPEIVELLVPAKDSTAGSIAISP